LPVFALSVIETDSIRHDYTNKDQLNEDKKVPSNFDDVPLRNDILRFAVDANSSIFCIESCEFLKC
jgi:hypothetical protein